MASYKRIPLKPFPNGWYVLAHSNELEKGQIITKRFAGKDVLLFRTESGKLAITEPYCPHMGGHFGYGGKVEGESIKCPFHHFCFDTKGDCTATGYGTKPSSKLKLPTYFSDEKNELILIWFDEKNNAPTWFVPQEDWSEWTEVRFAEFDFNSHPQETSENSVDVGHFGIVHGYTGVETLHEMEAHDHYLYAKYAMKRVADFVGKKRTIRTEFNVHVHGLGYSFVNTDIAELGMQTRHFVLPTPTDKGKLKLRIGVSIKKMEKFNKITPLLNLLPKKLAHKLLLDGAYKGYCHDVSMDFKIWENKIYIDPPILAKGDGPVTQYRMWAQQFYYDDSMQPNYVPQEIA
ncbi:MAG TPA: Rieske 2Fe-2S domain-containing protein [Chitinophagales bacterium]|mgnify:FL=1|jgi:nitrite reductase/ring-hydroxylating ferredoxin subunit|nr:Rieske 2Fe-2S domain-containing protein [Chitinophagales bacterium]